MQSPQELKHTLNYILDKRKNKRRLQRIITLTVVLSLLIGLGGTPLRDLITSVSGYSVVEDNSVDADSNVDALANIGTDGATSFANAQTLDGDDQIIQEGNGAGYVAGNDVDETHDQITDTQSPTDVGTYSVDSNMLVKDGTDNLLTEGQGAGYSAGDNNEDYVDTFSDTQTPTDVGSHDPTSDNLKATDDTDDTLTEAQGAGYVAGNNIEDYLDAITNTQDPADLGTYLEWWQMKAKNDSDSTLSEENVPLAGIDEYIDVDGWDATTQGWDDEIGDTLQSENYATGYIYEEKSDGATVDWFTFGSTSGTGVGFSANITLLASAMDTNDGVHVTMQHTGGATNWLEGTLIFSSGGCVSNLPDTWYTYTIDLTGTFSQAEIDSMEMSLEYQGVGGGDDIFIDHAYLGVSRVGSDNWQFDREFSFSSLDFDETNEELCIYTGTIGDEVMNIDVWTGVWTDIGTDIEITDDDTWVNISISTWLDASAEYFRFECFDAGGDSVQSTWEIDAVLIHSWTDAVNDYEMELEFAFGSLDTDETNEELCIFTGTIGDEELDILVWVVDTWTDIGTNILTTNDDTWVNISITTWLDSADEYFLFRGTSESGDSSQSTFGLDGVLIHSWTVATDDYEFDREFAMTGIVTTGDVNEELTIFTGTIGAENLDILVWHSAAWVDIGDILTTDDDTWVNISITTYLDASSEYFSFRDQDQSSDGTEDTFEIDYVGIHTWSIEVLDYELQWEHQAQSVDIDKDNYELTIFGYDPEDPPDIYLEQMYKRGQTYRHWYNPYTNTYRYGSDYLVQKPDPNSVTVWKTFDEYSNSFVIRLNNGSVYFLETPSEITNFISTIDNSTIWGIGVESFGGVLGFSLNFTGDYGHGQYLYYPRLLDGTLPQYNQPLYSIFNHLYAKVGATWYDQILNNKSLYGAPQNPRNNLHFDISSDTLEMWFNTDDVTILGETFDLKFGLKYNSTDRLFHPITEFRCTSRSFDDIGYAYEILATPMSDGTPYQPDRFMLSNETYSVTLDISEAWNASTYLGDFYSRIDIISENNESFTFDFTDMEQAGFTQKYLSLHDQSIPNRGTIKTLRAGMYGYGFYSQGTWINIDPVFSEKQASDSRDFYGTSTPEVFIDADPNYAGYLSSLYYYTFYSFDTGIDAMISSTSNAEMTIYLSVELIDVGDYMSFGLYDKGDTDEYWDETEADADEAGMYAQQTDMYWEDVSFFTTSGTGNKTIVDAKAGTLVDEWVTHHNNAPSTRSNMAILVRNGTNIDDGDYVGIEDTGNTEVDKYSTLTFDYALSGEQTFSAKQTVDEQDWHGDYNSIFVSYTVYPAYQYMRAGLNWDEPENEYLNSSIVWDTEITGTIASTSDAVMTIYVTAESVESGEYIGLGLYSNSTLVGGFWNETYADANDETAMTDTSDYYTNSSFHDFDGEVSTNVTIPDSDMGVFLDQWVTWHNQDPINRQYINFKWFGGTGIDTGEDDYIIFRESSHATVSERPTLTFNYILESAGSNENMSLQIWDWAGTQWDDLNVNITDVEQWYNVSFAKSYVDTGNEWVTWRYVDTNTSLDDTQNTLYIDYAGIRYWNHSLADFSSVDNADYKQDSGWELFDSMPLVITVTSGVNYDIQIKGVDGSGTPIANEYLRFDIDSDPSGGTNLTTTYQTIFTNQPIGIEQTHNIYIFCATPFDEENQQMTFTLWVQILEY